MKSNTINPKGFPVLEKYEIPEIIGVPFSLESKSYGFQNIINSFYLFIATGAICAFVLFIQQVTTKIPENYFEAKWARLEIAMCQIWADEVIAGGIQSLYNSCEDLCAYKFSDKLCRELKSSLTRHILNDMPSTLESYLCDDETFLECLENHWERFCNQMCVYVKPSGLLPIWNWGTSLLGECFMNVSTVRNKLISILLGWIQKEREGENIEQERIRKFMKMFDELGIYKEGFQKPIVEATHAYYLQQAEKIKKTNDLTDYYEYVQYKIKDEENRVFNYLKPTTLMLFHDVIEQQFIAITASSVIQSGLPKLLNNPKSDDIRKIYHLFSKSNVLSVLVAHFSIYVAESTWKILSSKDDNERLMVSLLAFYERLQEIIKHSFEKNNEFHLLFKDKFESALKKRSEYTAALFANFFDRKLKATQTFARKELDPILNKVVVMLGYIQGNRDFEKLYKKDLFSRLQEKSTSIDVEIAMLQKIGSEYGPELSSQLKKIVDGFEASKSNIASFKNSEFFTSGDMEFDATVLTQAAWPRIPRNDIQFPPEMIKKAQEYSQFYNKNQRKRKLEWHPYMGECVISADFPKEKCELAVCPAMATAIMVFNQKDDDLLTVKEIANSTKIEIQELKRILYTLAYGKNAILIHEKREKEHQIHLDDRFKVNDDFTHPDNLCKIEYTPLIECRERKIPKLTGQGSAHTLDAAIVKIIKEKKRLSHTSLIQYLKERLTSHVQVPQIKERINELINRSFITRDVEDMNLYIYNP